MCQKRSWFCSCTTRHASNNILFGEKYMYMSYVMSDGMPLCCLVFVFVNVLVCGVLVCVCLAMGRHE